MAQRGELYIKDEAAELCVHTNTFSIVYCFAYCSLIRKEQISGNNHSKVVIASLFSDFHLRLSVDSIDHSLIGLT